MNLSVKESFIDLYKKKNTIKIGEIWKRKIHSLVYYIVPESFSGFDHVLWSHKMFSLRGAGWMNTGTHCASFAISCGFNIFQWKSLKMVMMG